MATVAEPLVLEPSVAPVGGRRRLAPIVAMAAALLVLAVLGAVALAGRSGDGVVIDAASGVVIERPEGGPALAAPGDRLPDGTLVEIGPGGSATVDGTVYGPGRYLVVGGTLRPDPPEPGVGGGDERPGPAASTPSTTTPAPPATPPTAVSAPPTSAVPVARSTTTTAAPVPDSTGPSRTTEPPRATRPPSNGGAPTTRPARPATTTTVAATTTRPPSAPPSTRPPGPRRTTTTTTTSPPPSTRPSRP